MGREREIDGYRTCSDHHNVTRLNSIALLSTSGCIFKHKRVLILSWKMSGCKSERVNIKFLATMKKSVTETFQLLTEVYGRVSCTSV